MMSENTVITATDRAVKNLQSAVNAATKVIGDLDPLVQQAATLADDIKQRESELHNLNVQFAETERRAKAELELRLLENEEAVLNQLRDKRGLANIKLVDLSALHDRLTTAEEATEDAVKKAVAEATRALHAQYSSEVSRIKAEHAVASAEVNASVASLTDRNNFLIGEIASLRAQIEAERNTRLEIARAESQRQGVTVNAGKQ